jgi:undecaprenyl-diphosphatase
MIACVDCHTPVTVSFEKLTELEGPPFDQDMLFAGYGKPWVNEVNQIPSPPFPRRIYSANLTQDETGLKGYTADDLDKALRFGIGKDGSRLCPPMGGGKHHGMGFGYLKDEDRRDVINYVLALPPIFNTIPKDCRVGSGRPPAQAVPRISGVRALALVASLILGIFALGFALRKPTQPPSRVQAWRTILVTAGACVATLSLIAIQLSGRQVEPYDAAIALILYMLSGPKLEAVMSVLSAIATLPVVVIVAALLGIWAWTHGQRRAAVVLGAVFGTTELLNLLFRSLFGYGHAELSGAAALHSYAFPSGHVMAAAAIYGSAAIVAARLWPRLSRPLAIGSPILIFAIGVSRLYLSEHWVTDVFAGIAVGLLLCLGTAIALRGRSTGSTA